MLSDVYFLANEQQQDMHTGWGLLIDALEYHIYIYIPILRVVCFVLSSTWKWIKSDRYQLRVHEEVQKASLLALTWTGLGGQVFGWKYLGMVATVKTHQLQVQPVFWCRLQFFLIFFFYLFLPLLSHVCWWIWWWDGLSYGLRHSFVFQRPSPGVKVWLLLLRMPQFPESCAEISQELSLLGSQIARSYIISCWCCDFLSFKPRAFISLEISWLIFLWVETPRFPWVLH